VRDESLTSADVTAAVELALAAEAISHGQLREVRSR
jgi:hypothetical protein